MSIVNFAVIPFAVFLMLTIISCYIGDNDVVYKFLERKPSPKEAVARIRFVLLRGITSVYGGGILAFCFARYVLKDVYSIHVSVDQSVLLILFFYGVVDFLIIGIIQNGLRFLQGRQQRPLFDPIIWRHNLRQWQRPWDGGGKS